MKNSFIEETERLVNEIVEEHVKAVKDYIQTELQPPTKERLGQMIGESQIREMRQAEREAGLG